jgi:single stranded DNA-binding protein
MTPTEIIATVLRASCHRFFGRLGSDPEIKFFDNGRAVAKGRIAINKPGAKKDDGQEPDWFTVEVWGDQAQAFADQCRKGTRIDVLGRVKTNRWTTQAGEQRTDLIVTAEAWRSLEVPPPPAPVQKAAENLAQATGGTVVDDLDDSSIPF